MVKNGFEVSKNYIDIKYKKGEITRQKANQMVSELRKNYRNGTARKELELAGIKNYKEY